jgi:hypothetical protein
MLHDWGYARRQNRLESERLRWPRWGHRAFDDELPVEWLIDEIVALWRALRRPLSRRLARQARRRMLLLPARLITASIVEGQVVRLRGQIAFAPTAAIVADPRADIQGMVEAGGTLPDFALILDDGTSVAVAITDAADRAKLQVLDLWEDRQTHATCDERTSLLFRRTCFRPGQVVEVCGIAIRTIALDQVSAGYRGTGLQWRMVAAEESLSILFPSPPVTPRPDR